MIQESQPQTSRKTTTICRKQLTCFRGRRETTSSTAQEQEPSQAFETAPCQIKLANAIKGTGTLCGKVGSTASAAEAYASASDADRYSFSVRSKSNGLPGTASCHSLSYTMSSEIAWCATIPYFPRSSFLRTASTSAQESRIHRLSYTCRLACIVYSRREINLTPHSSHVSAVGAAGRT